MTEKFKILKPTAEQAEQFAVMLMAGMPGPDAIRYFFENEQDQTAMVDRWMASKEVAAAVKRLQNNKHWQDMTTDERIDLVLNKGYNEACWFLYSHNTSELVGAELAKAKLFREMLEVKQAGMAGKVDALSRFWDDIRSGRLVLPPASGPVRAPQLSTFPQPN